MARACTAHRYHYPAPLTLEEHHVLPQAWQNFALGREALFDRRTVTLCPTCHRNVHHWIVALMRGADRIRRVECQIASLALDRWVSTGRSLDDLVAHGLYGEA